MPKFFVTYGNNLIGSYSLIEAEDYRAAREIAHEGTDGGKFAFMYPESDLQRQTDLGYLNRGEIPLQAMEVPQCYGLD